MVLKKCSQEQYKLSIYDSIDLIKKDDWQEIQKDTNLYLSIPYLKSLELSMSHQVEFRYLMFYDNQVRPLGIAYVQILEFENIGDTYAEYLPKFGDRFSKAFLNKLGIKIMICGNTFVTGENGFAFCESMSFQDSLKLLTDGLLRLRNHEKEEDRVSVFLMKEFWEKSFSSSDKILKGADFRGFDVDVNMVLKLNPNWHHLDDYMADMRTKFRTKAKAAFKKSSNLVIKELRLNDIEKHQKRIEELFLNVLKRASFKLSDLNGTSFLNFKHCLKENNIVLGYFLDEKLIGFSSSFIDGHYLDANYVGIDYDFNLEHALYSRMLYDFVEISIRKGMKELRLGRTAEEIKSGVGGEPVHLRLYIKHTNKLSNRLLKSLVKNIVPSEFELRKPFKAEVYDNWIH
ncbi:MAG: hypothetical protein AAF487_04790 [Bacteroidota bacterium]